MSDWIKLSDRQPNFDGKCLIFAPSADPEKPLIHVAWWSLENRRWELVLGIWAGNVTHWMPLPDPPAE